MDGYQWTTKEINREAKKKTFCVIHQCNILLIFLNIFSFILVYFPFIKAIFFLLLASAFPFLPVSVNMSVGFF